MDSTETEYHRYYGIGHVLRRLVARFLTFVFAALWFLVVVRILTADWQDIDKVEISLQAVGDALTLLVGLPIGALAGLLLADMFPPVGINPHYLTVSFCFREFEIPWEDVVEITRVWYPFPKPLYAVRVKRLTLLHSIFYASSARFLSFRPTFLISSDIDGFDELMRILRSRLKDSENQNADT